MDLRELIGTMRELSRPSEDESRQLMELANSLVSSVREIFRGVMGFRDVSLEGSAARGTWTRQNPEVDVFVHFDADLPVDILEEVVVKRGIEAVTRLGGTYRLRYADHPYVEGIFSRMKANVVGCYDVPPGHWKSPVDRTPYHTKYIVSKMTDELRDDARALKFLLSKIDAYGAEVRVKGFSGYLAELLVIAFRSLENLLREASKWKYPVFIDIESTVDYNEAITKFPRDPLIVIDPVDRNRNVASAVSLTRLSEFVLFSKLLLNRPSLKFIDGRWASPDERGLRDALKGRETLMVKFRLNGQTPPDVLWGELYRSLKGIVRSLEVEGFSVYRSSVFVPDSEAFIMLELDSLTLPTLYKQIGPPVYISDVVAFVEKHNKDDRTVSGPWVEGDRVYYLKRREETRADQVLLRKLRKNEVSISRELSRSVMNATISTDREVIVRELLGVRDGDRWLHEFLIGRYVRMRDE
ncbi:MAG: CCA tRNA nucleotidyltransferase [Aigarchaeota archaeon]|nr:CCA tRNA nucleotidyltransferase [Aigarchaeota archaeon]MDW8092544.1 CCA tRNA nucleotidyltransferase [Nitrososphaerota archaeon]